MGENGDPCSNVDKPRIIFCKPGLKTQKCCTSSMFCFDVLWIWRHSRLRKHSRPNFFIITEKREIANFERWIWWMLFNMVITISSSSSYKRHYSSFKESNSQFRHFSTFTLILNTLIVGRICRIFTTFHNFKRFSI